MIFISPYLKGGEEAARLTNRTRYFATRDGVVTEKDEHGEEPATEKQKQYVLRLLKSFPQAMELGEYEDYAKAQTRETAASLIDQVWEVYIRAQDERENFLDYVAHRPGVKAVGEHGLWNADGRVQDLTQVVEEVAAHTGNVWTPVVSLRREDAERLGFTDPENWRALVNACTEEIAEGYKISPQNLRWYAALHEKEKHFHIHMVVYSSDPSEGYLTRQGIRDIKSAFATHMFEQDLVQVYERKTEYRNELQRSAEERMSELISQMRFGTIHSDKLEQLTEELAARLQNTKGRKVYGYLPPQVKRIVDEIVDELSRDERVASAYDLWQEMQDEICRTYSKTLPERLPLSQQKEFKPVRNMVIRETLKLSAQTLTYEDEDMDDEPEEAEELREDQTSSAQEPEPRPFRRRRSVYEQAERYRRAKAVLYKENAGHDEMLSALETLEKLWDEDYTIAAHQLGKAYRDGLGADRDTAKAVEWFRRSAERGNDCSAYALGKLLLALGDNAQGVEWLRRAAEAGNQFAEYRLGKVYLAGEQAEKNVEAALSYLRSSADKGNQYAQYALGKLYLLGREVERDKERAVEYLSRSAAQGNVYAQYFLDHIDDWQTASVGSAVIRMLHHMSRIFRQNAAADTIHAGMQIDRKRRRQLQEKRIAMGHKPDDHEEHVQGQTMN